ncbi:cytochrome c peroxidase [Trinickia caryophylli]|uniref:Cytochrome c peroxidase n=1 Tax=Trinickia caryophylli TaxID=28094 RepID=A0A1X7E0P9_TRICW|nr:cytochrome c peroxidase [Trinickia caryophylli]
MIRIASRAARAAGATAAAGGLRRWASRMPIVQAAAIVAFVTMGCAPSVAQAPRSGAGGVVRAAAVRAASEAGSDAVPMTRAEVFAAVQAKGELGEKLFSERALSGSGKLACASCHSPAHAFGPPNALAVQLGGSDLRRPGYRAVPSLMYLQSVPAFTEHFHDSDDEGDESVDAGPTGGLTWDGRVDARSAQAAIPLTSSFEMDSTPARVAAAVRAAPYADAFRAAFGARVLDDDQAAFRAVGEALSIYEERPSLFAPFSSKYDAYLAGRAKLTDAELRGLRLFEDERKGNCASCHPSAPAKDGSPPLFTDFGLIALGVPRNRALPANRDPKFYDLGACGPWRTDLAGRDEFCGLFRTPTLRNVATRKTFFHNGAFHSLEDVLHFYVERDTHPKRFYSVVAGRVAKFDDLPKRYWGNVNIEPPFDRHPGDEPALDEREIRDVVAFLRTLDDGYGKARQ